MKKYPAYKDSDIEWIREIPEHWVSSKLKHILAMSSGFAPPEDKDKYIGEFPIFGANGIIGYCNQNNLDKKAIIIGRVGASGEINIAPKNSWVSDNALIVNLNSEVNFEYVTYLLISLNLNEMATKNAQPLITGGLIRNVNFALPPQNEQQAIADFLDKKMALIDTLIEKKKRQIELLKEQRQAVINQAVTKGLYPDAEMKDSGIEWLGEIPKHWGVKKLRYVFNMNTGLSVTKEELQESGIPCVNYGDIHTRYGFDLDLSRDKLNYVDEKFVGCKQSALALENDFVFCDTSEDIEGSGNCVYIKRVNSSQIFAGSHTILAKPIMEVNSRYLAYLFMSKSWRPQVQSIVYGIKVYSITQKILKDTFAILPPLSEQQEISDFLDFNMIKIETSISKAKKQIELLQEYRTALISEAVTGKIDVREAV